MVVLKYWFGFRLFLSFKFILLFALFHFSVESYCVCCWWWWCCRACFWFDSLAWSHMYNFLFTRVVSYLCPSALSIPSTQIAFFSLRACFASVQNTWFQIVFLCFQNFFSVRSSCFSNKSMVTLKGLQCFNASDEYFVFFLQTNLCLEHSSPRVSFCADQICLYSEWK